jgi:hypothetical protein
VQAPGLGACGNLVAGASFKHVDVKIALGRATSRLHAVQREKSPYAAIGFRFADTAVRYIFQLRSKLCRVVLDPNDL